MSRRLVEFLNSWIFDDEEELYALILVYIAHLATEIHEMNHCLPDTPAFCRFGFWLMIHITALRSKSKSMGNILMSLNSMFWHLSSERLLIASLQASLNLFTCIASETSFRIRQPLHIFSRAPYCSTSNLDLSNSSELNFDSI